MATELKHTPGPWQVHIDSSRAGHGHSVTAGTNEQIIIMTTGRFDGASASDARLIAAAPELLAFARLALVEVWDGNTLGLRDALSCSHIRDKARAVIALAAKGTQ